MNLNTVEKVILGIALVAVCLAIGASQSGQLTQPWIKGASGAGLAAIGLYIMYKVYKAGKDKGQDLQS